jgi:type IV pilus assembly protein PilC
MPTFQFEAIDATTGKEIRDVIDAPTESEAQTTIRQMGYLVTKLKVAKGKTGKGGAAKKKDGRTFALGRAKAKDITLFTRQLSILQDAGLPIMRSLKVLAEMQKPGALKNGLLDVCDEIEGGSTLSEAMSKSPKVFDRLYCNMIRAGETAGALEVILRRLSEFMERAQSLKRKVKGAMVYPIVVVSVAVGILTFIMLKIVPQFKKMFNDFGTELPAITQLLVDIADWVAAYWWLIPAIPFGFKFFLKLLCKIPYCRMGWDIFSLKVVVFGQLVEKNIVSRSARTLGTLLASGVPILEALNITKETSGNMMFERLFGKVSEAIRDGEAIAKPLKEYSVPPLNLAAAFFWTLFVPAFGVLMYLMKYKTPVMDDLVINMVDVGEESGELDTMLYKVADVYDEEVAVLTESLTSLMEPLLIVFLGGAVGFIVIALFMPLIKLIQTLT